VLSTSDVNAMLTFEAQRDFLGCGDTACAANIGNSLGVDAIVTSRLGMLGGTRQLTLALILVGTGEVLVRAVARTQSGVEAFLPVLNGLMPQVLVGVRKEP
jgi:hypothetical protein